MKKMFRLAIALILSVTLFSTTSCDKDDDVRQEPIEVQLLTAKIWQIEEVKEVDNRGTGRTTFKKGAEQNEDDFSLVRQAFKRDGSITYTGQFGETGSDGRYQLLANSRLRLSVGILTTIVEQVVIRENSFSYRLMHEDGGYMQFTFTPVQ